MKNINCFVIILNIILILFVFSNAFAAQSLQLDDSTTSGSLSRVLEYYVDIDKGMKLEDFLSGKYDELFRPGNGKTYNFGFRQANYWVRFSLNNQGKENEDFLLIYNYPFIKQLDVFLPQSDGSFQQVTGGCYYPLPENGIRHRNHIFKINLPVGEQRTYYLRFSSDTTFLMDLRIQSHTFFTDYEKALSSYLSILFGIFITLALIHLRNYLYLRDSINLLFSAYTVVFVLYLTTLMGFGNQYFWPHATWWAMNSVTLFAGATLAFGVLFSREFLQIKKHAPGSDRCLLILSILFFLSLGLLPINPLYSHYLSSAFAMLIIFVIMHTTWRVWKQGYQPAKQFFIAWLMFLVGGLVFFMTILGVIIPSIVTLHSLHIGFAVGVIVLSFAMDERVNLLHQIAQDKISRVVDERTRQLDRTVQTMKAEIDERKRVEGELRESKNLFQIAFQTSPDSVIINRLSDGVCMAVNEGFTQISGFTEAEVLGRTTLELGIWRSEEERHVLVKEVEKHGYADNLEVFLRTKSGQVRTALISARIINIDGEPHILSISRDITERKASEMALDEKHSQLQSLLSAIPDMVYFKDVSGRILIVNKAFAGMLGREIDEIVGRMDEEVMPADMLEIFRQGDTLAIAQRITIRSEEKGSGANGHSRYYDTIRVPIFDSEDRLIGLVGVSRDITERKKSEEDKRRLEEQLMQSQKMEAIGRLAGGVAHDFNNILTGITGYAEIALSEAGADNPVRDEMAEILRAADRAAALIQQLLAFSRKQIISPKVVQLNDLITQSQKMLARIIGEDIRFSFRPADDLWRIKIDAVQMDQILVNLAANARDAMPNGGSLVIETRNISFGRDNAQQFRGMDPGDYALLTVTDTGAGMDEETKGRIFEPFFSTKAVNKGTGLGLSTVYGVVKQNDGFINVYSEPGQGTTFRIYLPRTEEVPSEVHHVSKTAAPTGSELVMVVEDEMMVRSLVRKVLMRHGYQVLMANNGEEALALMDRLGRPIDLLLTDVVMPQINGKDLYRKLSSRQPHLKVLYMSGYTEDIIAHHGVLERGTRFIQKPFSIDVLLQEVRDILDGDD